MTDIFLRALRQTARLIDDSFDELLPESKGPEASLFEAMEYALKAGGKRLRPFMVIQTADLFSVPRDYSVRVATALEMLHTYSLVHDDLPSMDDDDTRRGKPTIHIKYDEAMAVLVGDALQSLAFEIIADAKTHPSADIRIELIQKMAHAAGGQGMAGGQTMDIYADRDAIDMANITRLQQLKTGALIAYACESGAVLGHASPAERNSIRAYAHDLGLSFQIMDDILDAEGDPEEMGKATGKDEKAGKATFVSLLGLEEAKIHARMLAEQAVSHLHSFGTKADLLCRAATFTIERRT
jgi:farnesyl diphosphate synthase